MNSPPKPGETVTYQDGKTFHTIKVTYVGLTTFKGIHYSRPNGEEETIKLIAVDEWKPRKWVYLDPVLYAVDKVLDARIRDKEWQFLIRWEKPNCKDDWQPHHKLTKKVNEEGSSVIQHKLYKKLQAKKNRRISKVKKIKKEEDSNY
jgi:hypothetical protein